MVVTALQGVCLLLSSAAVSQVGRCWAFLAQLLAHHPLEWLQCGQVWCRSPASKQTHLMPTALAVVSKKYPVLLQAVISEARSNSAGCTLPYARHSSHDLLRCRPSLQSTAAGETQIICGSEASVHADGCQPVVNKYIQCADGGKPTWHSAHDAHHIHTHQSPQQVPGR